MKSPWQFLVGLARRHDKQGAPSEADAMVTPPSEAPTNPHVNVANLSAEKEPERVDALAALVAMPTAAAKDKAKKPVTTRGTVAEKPRRRAPGNKRTSVVLVPAQLVAPGDPTRELDDEIHQLRSQLAQKLELQNAQLRRMLARFEK